MLTWHGDDRDNVYHIGMLTWHGDDRNNVYHIGNVNMTSMVMIWKLLIRIVKVVQKSAYGDVNDVNNDGIKVGKSAINKDSVDVDDDGEIGSVRDENIDGDGDVVHVTTKTGWKVLLTFEHFIQATHSQEWNLNIRTQTHKGKYEKF